MSSGVGRRWGLDLMLLWLWHRPVATAPVQSLAWEPPYVIDAALKRPKKKKNLIILSDFQFARDFEHLLIVGFVPLVLAEDFK